jgi:dihydrolipoamide dehydrogenase
MSKEISVDLAIIGAGTAGISAFKEASKVTKKILLIDHGPLGTTCARVGCMPSKALIQVADYFHDRINFGELGINGADKLNIDISAVMKHVRKLRDYFTSSTLKYIESLGKQFIKGSAEFFEPNILKINQHKIIAKNIIIATGTSSIVPNEWHTLSNQILTSENIFEQESFQKKIAVIGAGPIGIELGQALSRLGIEINMFHSHEFIGELSDPVVNACAIKIFQNEFSLHLNHKATVEKDKSLLNIKSDKILVSTDQIVAALGQKPNLETLNLERIGIKLDKKGLPLYDRTTMKIENFPIYIAGDAGKFKPLQHEAADDGRITGYNAVREKPLCFARRTPLMIIFSQPNIAIVGKSFKDLEGMDFIIGEVSFEDQGRSRIMMQNTGILRIYADRKNGKLLGSEMIAPDGEHLAHLLALVIQQNMTVFDFLQMPFYHPTVEEGLRTALRGMASQVNNKQHENFELLICE